MKRSDILNEVPEDCSDEFTDKLIAFIDDIEGRVSDILNTMEIKSITDIGYIETAYDDLKDLAKDLW